MATFAHRPTLVKQPSGTTHPKIRLTRRQRRLSASTQQMKQYVWQVLANQEAHNFIKLPSVKALNGHFHVRAEDILLTLEKLRAEGFDYEIINGTEPILVWESGLLAS